MIYYIIAFIFSVTIMSCTAENEKAKDSEKVKPGKDERNIFYSYNLDNPDKKVELPSVLNEVSGIAFFGGDRIACIQDETGKVFVLDYGTSRLVREIKFGPGGDYEGIAVAGKDMWVLRSDGALYRIINFAKDKPRVKKYKSDVPAADIEGLCFSEKDNALLIACKSDYNGKHEKKYKDKKLVYAFGLDKMKTGKKPFLEIDIDDLSDFARDMGYGRVKTFNPSEIAFHPDGDIVILSGSDNLIISIGRDGDFKKISELDRKLFPQAEGLTFAGRTMLISNEGRLKPATILMFSEKINNKQKKRI